MKSTKREIYVEITIYFCIFVLYSFSLQRISLSTIAKYKDLYEEFAKIHIESRINNYIDDIESSLNAFSISSYTDIKNMATFKDDRQKVIDGLNLYNKIFRIEGKVYLVINNEEVYSSTDTEYYFERNADDESEEHSQINNSDKAIRELISSHIIDNGKRMTYICDANTGNTFYFIYPIYDSATFTNAYVIKECDLKLNSWIFDEILSIYDIQAIDVLDENGEIIYSNSKEVDKPYKLGMINSAEEISASLERLQETIAFKVDSGALLRHYMQGASIIAIIIFLTLLLCMCSFFMKDAVKWYKITIFGILLSSLLIGYVTKEYCIKNCIEIYEKNVMNIKAEDILDENNLKIRMRNASTYIKRRVDYMYEKGGSIDYVMEKKEDLIYLARKTRRYLAPYALGYYYTFNGELYSGEVFTARSVEDSLKEHIDSFMSMSDTQYEITFKDTHDKTKYRLLTKSVDENDNLILIFGLDFDFKNYNRRVALLHHMYHINNDSALYEIDDDGKIRKIIVKNKEQGIYYQDLNKYVEDIDEEDIEQIKRINEEGTITGHYSTGKNKDKKYKFYVKTMYDENYLVITIDSESIEALESKVLNYESFMLLTYILFSLSLFQRQIFFADKYTVKEHEMHSNY